MPEQQPDKRCGTCKHWSSTGLRPFGNCRKFNFRNTDTHYCDAWTPKTPKNPEEK